MIVKPVKTIVNILLDVGYIFGEDGLFFENRPVFLYEMFQFCGGKPPSGIFWDPDWLEMSPEDCVGFICSVWDGEEEPSIKRRVYRRVTSYSSVLVLPVLTHNESWRYAKKLNEEDFKKTTR